MPNYSLSAGPSSCTICGKHYYDRSAFNAHIRAHLKEKLRRKTDTGSVTCPPSPAANSPQQVALHLPSSPKQAKMETNQHTQFVMSPGIKVEPHAPDLLQPSFTKQQVSVASHLLQQQQRLIALSRAQIPAASFSARTPPSTAATLHFSQPPQNIAKPAHTTIAPTINALPTPDISDMEEDPMSAEIEMNRIDFRNDISSLLDQIEQDFQVRRSNTQWSLKGACIK